MERDKAKFDILNKILEERTKRGWSEYTLAQNAGLTQSTISTWYRKDLQPSVASIEKVCDYLVKLHDDILEAFPAGKLPPAELMSQRDPEEIEKLLKGPLNGGKHIYTLGWPTWAGSQDLVS